MIESVTIEYNMENWRDATQNWSFFSPVAEYREIPDTLSICDSSFQYTPTPIFGFEMPRSNNYDLSTRDYETLQKSIDDPPKANQYLLQLFEIVS